MILDNLKKLATGSVRRRPLVSVIRLSGPIAMGGRVGLTHQDLERPIERAFKRGRPVAVALAINSPGGSPVQSSMIASTIRDMAEETGKPVHAFVEDVAASGGYWLATAADDIWADANSVLGSIGVISAGFGAHVLLARNGIERRVHVAGKSKGAFDPFRPERPEDVAKVDEILQGMHAEFVGQVKARRGERVDESADLFSGEFWTARRAVELGLADGIGHLKPRMRAVYGDSVRFRMYQMRKPFMERIGSRIAGDALDVIETRAAYARFGF